MKSTIKHMHTATGRHPMMGVAFAALAAAAICSLLPGCTQTVVHDNSVNARLGASLPPGAQVHYGSGVSGGEYRSDNTQGTQVPAGSYLNPAAPNNWVNGWGAGGQ